MNDVTLVAPEAAFLSRVVLRSRALRDVHDLHGLLWKAFPGWSPADPSSGRREGPGGEFSAWPPFLWRADHGRDDDGVRFTALVQSLHHPTWERLGDALDFSEVRRVAWSLATGQRRRFLLRANPTRSRKDARQTVVHDGETAKLGDLSAEDFRARRGVRVALWSEDLRGEWLARKLEGAGSRIVTRVMRDDPGDVPPREVAVGAVRTQSRKVWRWQRRGDPAWARHDGVDFEGILEVVDPEGLRRALFAGIGPAKGFGFGMLSLALQPGEAGSAG